MGSVGNEPSANSEGGKGSRVAGAAARMPGRGRGVPVADRRAARLVRPTPGRDAPPRRRVARSRTMACSVPPSRSVIEDDQARPSPAPPPRPKRYHGPRRVVEPFVGRERGGVRRGRCAGEALATRYSWSPIRSGGRARLLRSLAGSPPRWRDGAGVAHGSFGGLEFRENDAPDGQIRAPRDVVASPGALRMSAIIEHWMSVTSVTTETASSAHARRLRKSEGGSCRRPMETDVRIQRIDVYRDTVRVDPVWLYPRSPQPPKYATVLPGTRLLRCVETKAHG